MIPAAPVVAPAPVVYGSIAVRTGGGTRLLVPTVDGRALPALRVRPGPRRLAVRLPSGHWRVRVRAVGLRGARASGVHDVWVLPARAHTAGTSRGRVDRVLQRRVQALSAGAPFVNGIYARNLVTGCGAAVNAGAPFPAASTLKAAILLDAVRRPHGEPAALLDRMIIDSDDVAANQVLGMQGGGDALAGAAGVTATMRAAGMTRSLVRRPYIIDQERIPVDALAQPELYTNYVATPYDLATLMVGLHQASIGRGPVRRMGVGPMVTRREITRRLLSVRDRSKIVAGVPASMPVAHKTGYTTEIKADAGIVYAPRGPIVLSVMGWSNSGASEAFIADVARAVVGRLSGGGACR
ncbi:MAG: serine hydrolase [Thermoleophilia bacterium]|nr:serine hydrolase [Thermoleophilia bacterium]